MTDLIPLALLCADAAQDIRKKEIFPIITAAGAAAGTVYMVVAGKETLSGAAASLLPGCIFLIISILSREQVGRGDSLALMLAGAWSGAAGSWGILFFSLASASAFAMVLWIRKKRNREFPFAPFILAGFIFSRLYGTLNA